MKEVYCKNCKHWEKRRGNLVDNIYCNEPTNENPSSCYSNRKNNCPHYKPKFWRLIFKGLKHK
jgi:hypothetical protein